MKGATPELAYVEAGDEVSGSYHREQIVGKWYNVVDELSGIRNADGMTPWEERAAEAESTSVDEPEPTATQPATMPVEDLPDF